MSKMYTDYVSSLREDKHQQQRSCLFACVLCTLVSVTILLICITVGLRYSGSRNVLTYPSTVGDTRLISYSAPLCSGGQMDVSESLSGYVGNMYFLDDKPPLTASSFLVLAGNIDASIAYDYDFYSYGYSTIVYGSYQFHLNENSVISTTSCVSNGDPANFIVIQGNSNFNRWLRGLSSSYYAYDTPIAACGSGQNSNYLFTINQEAYYYVVYYIPGGSGRINFVLTVDRTEYAPSQAPSCSLGSDTTCTAESQSSTKYVLFQTLRPNNNATITNYVPFDLVWRCDSNDGVYAAIFFVPLIILTLLLCGCFGIFCICGHYRDRH